MSHTPVSASNFDSAKPRWRRAVAGAHHLLRLALAAIRSAPERPLLAGTNCVQRIPELGRDAGVRRILHDAYTLAMLDLPPDLAAELKVISTVIDRPGAIGLHQNAVIGRGNQLLQPQRLLARQQADISHPNHGQTIPTFGPKRSSRAILTDGVRGLARTEIAGE